MHIVYIETELEGKRVFTERCRKSAARPTNRSRGARRGERVPSVAALEGGSRPMTACDHTNYGQIKRSLGK